MCSSYDSRSVIRLWKKAETNENGDEVVELTWYQVGDAQKDAQMVIDEVNKYTSEKSV